MIRTLSVIAVVSFVLCVVSLAGAVAVAGGPFYIGDGLRFHRTTLPLDDTSLPTVPMKTLRGEV
jgi:hypothetical protein